jgi:hypothetical protein
LQRGRRRRRRADGEAKAAGLTGAVIGVLSENDDFHLVERTFVEGAKNLRRRRIDPAGDIFAADKFPQRVEIGLFEFRSEMFAPAFFETDGFGHLKQDRGCRQEAFAWEIKPTCDIMPAWRCE